ncbi:MAG: 2-oxoglutarate and iron-dependent oxygenase domain-containing protein [Ilumatobacteraceae bacterium]
MHAAGGSRPNPVVDPRPAGVPIVDLSGPTDSVAAAVDAACRSIGFLGIVGHGVPAGVVERAFAAATAFFDLPVDERMRVAMPEPGYPYGYSPFRGEALERSLGTDAPTEVDLKETYNIGPIDPPPRPLAEMTDPDERAVYAPNLWPDGALPGFRPALEAYYRALADLSRRLMSVFALALGLQGDHFEPFVDRHGSALRLAHYPALDRRPRAGQLRAGAHTDYGTLTVLATDGAPGLQVQSPTGAWIDVAHVDGGFVVNLGDLMARWTNDRWRSTMHRVVVPADDPGRRRISIPFFHNANWDARIECVTAPGETPRYPPVLAGQHLMSKFRSTVSAPSDGSPVA